MIPEGRQKQTDDAHIHEEAPSIALKISAKHLTIGVYITQQDLTLVLTSIRRGGKKKGLLKWRNIPLPENLFPDSNEFPAFLKDCLDNFTENRKKISIWSTLESSSLKIKNITIPDLPQGKLTNAAFWGLKRETEFNEDREIFDYEILGDVQIDGIKKKKILVFSAPKKELKSLKRIFHLAGYPLTGITAIPFAIHNFIRTQQIRVDDLHFAIINVSRETSEIYCFSQSGILLVRNLRTGSQNLIEELDAPLDTDPVEFFSSMESTTSAEFLHIRDSLERLISKIVRTGDYCAQYYTGNRPIKRYIFYGETDQCDPFMELAASIIPADVDILDPSRESCTGYFKAELPPHAKQRSSVLTAFGIALSANKITPNFLFTLGDQQKAKKQKKITFTTAFTGIVLLIFCFFFHSMLMLTHQKDLMTLTRINQEQTTYGNDLPKQTITRTISMAEATDLEKTQYISTYLPLAVVYEICHFSIPPVLLTAMKYQLEENKENRSRKVLLEGEISAPPHILDLELASYLLKLSESPVFGYIEITAKQVVAMDSAQKLVFTATLEVL